ncbi:MAG: hypothetical protein QOI17_355 [Gaiellales bacterium]|jgi:hypothetical protein|nr:hypothetical protein [Gaiellales bacterium]
MFAAAGRGHGRSMTLKPFILRSTVQEPRPVKWVRIRNRRSAGVIARERAADERQPPARAS